MATRPVSARESAQFQELDPAQQELIYQDLASRDDVGEEPITINFNNGGRRIAGPMFASDASDTPAQGPLSVVAPALAEAATPPAPVGALSAVAGAPRPRAPVDMAAMLRDMVGPQGQDQSSKWLALAAAFGKPTQSGSIGETFGNVAQAMQEHKVQQEKLRAQYLPLIMQKVAAQQQAEERAQAQAEAQQVAIQARQQAAAQQQQFQAQQSQLARQQQLDIANAARESREAMAADRNTLLAALKGQSEGQADATPSPVLGVPLPTVFPWANQSNERDKNKVRAAEGARGSKEIEKDNDAARKEQLLANKASQFLALNAKVDTGGVLDKVAPGRWVKGFDSDYASMEGLAAELIPGMREPGSGSTSDLDLKMFERATFGVGKPKQTNDNIGRAMMARAKQAQDYVEFRNTYLEQNGTLQGADRYWADYTKKNPIFDPAQAAEFGLNAKRQDWRGFFSSPNQQAGTQGSVAQPTGQPDLAALAAAELAKRVKK